MNDDRLEREIRLALARDDEPAARQALRDRVAAIPDVASRRRFAPVSWFALLAAAAATLVLAAAGISLVLLHPPVVAPGGGPAASTRPSQPSASAPIWPPTSGLASISGIWAALSWSPPGSLPGAVAVTSLATARGVVYAAGQAQDESALAVAVWASADGTTWTRLTASSAFAGAQSIDLVATADGLVAWGAIGQPTCAGEGAGQTCGPVPEMIWTSTDGATWQRLADPSVLDAATIRGIAAGAAGLVAVGDGGPDAPVVWTSVDGATWQRLTLGTTFAHAHFAAVRATGQGYLIGGSTGGTQPAAGGAGIASGGSAAAWWSSDGHTWVRSTVALGNGGTSISEIHAGSQGFVAVGGTASSKGRAAWTSTDGRTWQAVAIGSGTHALPAAFLVDNGGHLVAVRTSGNTLQYFASLDGASWHPMAETGATSTVPVESGDLGHPDRWLSLAAVVPDGLILIGSSTGDPAVTPSWHATASR